MKEAEKLRENRAQVRWLSCVGKLEGEVTANLVSIDQGHGFIFSCDCITIINVYAIEVR